MAMPRCETGQLAQEADGRARAGRDGENLAVSRPSHVLDRPHVRIEAQHHTVLPPQPECHERSQSTPELDVGSKPLMIVTYLWWRARLENGSEV